MSKVKQLAKMFGGTWRYDGLTRWVCDDGRYVARESDGVNECGDVTAVRHVMYDEHGNGKRVFFGPNASLVNFL